jgi:prepilin-type N-terminal cleavage/methylation domain-containing protein
MRIKTDKPAGNGTKAFTIAEVVVAIVIVGIGAAGLMGCFNYAYFVTQLTRENQRATQIMLERAEAIRLCSWDQVCSNGFIPATFSDYYDPTGDNASRGATYSGTVAITPFPFATSYSANMRQLTLTVNWQTGQIAHSRTNITNIAKDGIQNYVY